MQQGLYRMQLPVLGGTIARLNTPPRFAIALPAEVFSMRKYFMRSLVLVLLAILASARSVARAAEGVPGASPALTISLEPLNAEYGAADAVAVRFTLANTSDASVRVLKWNTPFDSLDGDMFDITASGASVGYIGRLTKRGHPGANDYVTLGPGESASAVVDLGRLYAIGSAGGYTVRFRMALLRAHSAGRVGRPVLDGAVRVDAQPEAVVLLLKERRSPQAPMSLPPAFNQCSSSQISTLNLSLAGAEALALNAMNALATSPEPLRPAAVRYTTWFGAYLGARYAAVTGHFQNVYLALSRETVTFDCTCNEQGTLAYVYPNQPYVVYVCPVFWSAPATGTDSQPGVLIHEMSHFDVVAGTDDHAYGQSGSMALAVSNPSQAIQNADSLEYFAEDTPALFMWVPAYRVHVPAAQREVSASAW